jgi:hypothetical protein
MRAAPIREYGNHTHQTLSAPARSASGAAALRRGGGAAGLSPQPEKTLSIFRMIESTSAGQLLEEARIELDVAR